MKVNLFGMDILNTSLQTFFFYLNEHLNIVFGNFYSYIIPVYF